MEGECKDLWRDNTPVIQDGRYIKGKITEIWKVGGRAKSHLEGTSPRRANRYFESHNSVGMRQPTAPPLPSGAGYKTVLEFRIMRDLTSGVGGRTIAGEGGKFNLL